MEQFFIEELTGHFNLREPKSRKPSTIFFVVRLDGKQYKLPIGVKCYPKFWNTRKQECYTGVNISDLDQRNNLVANQKINEVKARFLEYKQYLCDNIPKIGNKVELLRSYILLDMKKKEEVIDIVRYFTDYVTNTYPDGTARSYHNALKLLDAFIKHRKKQPTIKEMATSDFFNDLISFLVKYYTKEDGTKLLVGYTNDSIGKLKTILKKAVEDKLITETDRRNIVYKKLIDKSANDNELFLWNNEVVQLFEFHCEDKKDELIKDIFLLECTTGQRLSDVTKVDDNIEESFGVEEVTLVTKKTSKKIRFLLVFDIAKKILEKYNYNIPAVSTSDAGENTIMNKHLKKIAKSAGITRKWTQSKHQVGTAKPTVIEKEAWEFMKTHVGRHTFICLLKLRGWDNSRIAKYTGQTIEVVEAYANSLKDSDYKRYENIKENHPEQIVKTIEEVAEATNNSKSQKKESVANIVFGYDKLMELYDMVQHNLNVHGLPLTKKCRDIILSTNGLTKIVDFCKDKDVSELKKEAIGLDEAIKILTRIYSDIEIYKTYEYKMLKLGFIKDMTPPEELETLFHEPTKEELEQMELEEYLKNRK